MEAGSPKECTCFAGFWSGSTHLSVCSLTRQGALSQLCGISSYMGAYPIVSPPPLWSYLTKLPKASSLDTIRASVCGFGGTGDKAVHILTPHSLFLQFLPLRVTLESQLGLFFLWRAEWAPGPYKGDPFPEFTRATLMSILEWVFLWASYSVHTILRSLQVSALLFLTITPENSLISFFSRMKYRDIVPGSGAAKGQTRASGSRLSPWSHSL